MKTPAIFLLLLPVGILAGCGSSESATGTTRADAGPATGGTSAAGGSTTTSSAGGTPSSGGVSNSGSGGKTGSAGAGGAAGGAGGGAGVPSAGGAAGTGGAPGDVSCDPRKILCKRVAPECGTMEVPSVDGSCYGPCVAIGQCTCTVPDECPDSNQYTCNKSAAHCTPYLL